MYLHSVVLGSVVSDGLQERLCVVTQRDSARVQLGFIGCRGARRATVVLVLLLVVVIVDLTGLKASAKDGRLQPFWKPSTKPDQALLTRADVQN